MCDHNLTLNCARCGVAFNFFNDDANKAEKGDPPGIAVFEHAADKRTAAILADLEARDTHPSVVFTRPIPFTVSESDPVCQNCIGELLASNVVRELTDDDLHQKSGELKAYVSCATCGRAETDPRAIMAPDQASGIAADADETGVVGAYGSRHDCIVYKWTSGNPRVDIGFGVICDSCVDNLVKKGALVQTNTL